MAFDKNHLNLLREMHQSLSWIFLIFLRFGLLLNFYTVHIFFLTLKIEIFPREISDRCQHLQQTLSIFLLVCHANIRSTDYNIRSKTPMTARRAEIRRLGTYDR